MLCATLRQLVLLRQCGCQRYSTAPLNVFDRKTKRKQRNRAAMAPDADTYDYLKDRVSR